MHYYEFNNYTQAALDLCHAINTQGKKIITPRTGEFLELRNVTYTVDNSTDRLIPFETLKQHHLWAYGEVLTEFLGLNPPIMEQYTNPESKAFMAKFHRGDGRANYTYGERWHVNQQFQRTIDRLLADRYSRQAIMTIWDPGMDQSQDETNVPCTIMHHFMIRPDKTDKGSLHTNVYIRSNDFFKGWKYDIFLNSFIHEAFAGFLQCNPGELTYIVGSMHIYKSDYDKIDKLLDETVNPTFEQQPKFNLLFNGLYDQLWTLYHMIEASKYIERDISKLEPIFHKWLLDYNEYNRKNSTWRKY
jgi:thymidylate synthase